MFSQLSFNWPSSTPLILQQQTSECGPACIAMISGHYGNMLSMSKIRQQCVQNNYSLQGMNLLQLSQLAELNELTARAFQCEIDELESLTLPCILHWDLQHFVVLTKIKKQTFHIHDPASGSKVFSLAQLSKHFTGVALSIEPALSFTPNKTDTDIHLRDLWAGSNGFSSALWQIGMLSITLQLLSLSTPYYLQWIMDEVLLTFDKSMLFTLAFGFSGVLIFTTMVNVLRSWIITRFTSFLAVGLSDNVMSHLLKLPHEYFVNRHLGDIASRFGSVNAINERISAGITETIVDGIMVLSVVGVMLLYGWTLTLIVVGFMLLYGILRWVFFQPLRQATLCQLEYNAKADTLFFESLRAHQTITLFNQTARRKQLWANDYVNAVNAGIELSRWNIGFETINKLIFGFENIMVIMVATIMVMDQSLSIGMMIAFIAYKTMFTQRIANLVEQGIAFKMLRMHLERLGDIIDTPIQPNLTAQRALPYHRLNQTFLAKDNNDSRADTSGELVLDNVSFHYPGSEDLILNQINLTINAGEKVVISGPSGGGKTTLLKIMLGLIAPTSGCVRYNGVDITQLGLVAYRSQIATVMQDDLLLAGTIEENITLFDEEPKHKELLRILEQCQLLDMVNRLPMGINTLIGELGAQLSGGQIQRILLARALYQRPHILYLDEATSALDKETEQAIISQIKHLGMTQIQIAHRQETIKNAEHHYQINAHGLQRIANR